MTKKLWGGRFSKPVDPAFEAFSQSIHYDYKLVEYDILHSLLHVVALHHANLISKEEVTKLREALLEIASEVENKTFKPDLQEEDIHSNIQNELEKRIGKTALKVHTLRSRNDQIAFDTKLYCFAQTVEISKCITGLMKSFLQLADQNVEAPFIGYTHTQRAQILLFSDYCMAYYHMFARDWERLKSYLEHLKVRIGGGALAGSSIPHQDYSRAIRLFVKEHQAEIHPVENALEHVADRDFIVELQSILSMIQMHISRFAEDMILYSTAEFNIIDLPEAFCTGSSLMPHKKNADFMELARGYTGRIYGDLLSILTILKGLPLSYNRDMQLDKEPLFHSVDIVQEELRMLIRFVPEITLKEENIARALSDEYLYGVEITEFLVKNQVSFKEAHDLVGQLIRYSEEKKIFIKKIEDEVLKGFHPALNRKVLKEIMTPEFAIEQKKSIRRK